MAWTISLIALFTVVVLCVVGAFHSAFKDNLLQCLGMGVLALGFSGRISELLVTGIPDGLVVSYSGIALFALGMMSKVIVYRGRERGWRAILDWDHWLRERKTASGAFDSKPHHHT